MDVPGFIASCRGSQNKKRTSYEMRCFFKMVVGDGFEPSNSERADLQSAAFDRSAIPPFFSLERVRGVEPL